MNETTNRKDQGKSMRLTVREIERLPSEEFAALPESDKERYYDFMTRDNQPSAFEFYGYAEERDSGTDWCPPSFLENESEGTEGRDSRSSEEAKPMPRGQPNDLEPMRDLEDEGLWGYSNRDTWVVWLWLNDSEVTYRYWKQAAREEAINAVKAFEVVGPDTNVRGAVSFYLSERLRTEITRRVTELGPSLYAKMLATTLSEVDWQEVAEEFLKDGSNDVPRVAPKFPLGDVVSTLAVLKALAPEEIAHALSRHAAGDWGELEHYDWLASDTSLETGGQILSLYCSWNKENFYVVTNPERLVTTVMMTNEY